MSRLVLMLAATIVAAVVYSGSAEAVVYSCPSPQVQGGGGGSTVLYLNNAQVATANVTVKVQASTGANLNASLSPAVTQNFTIAAGNTKTIAWAQTTCTGFCYDSSAGTNATTVPFNVRVVSDQELGVALYIVVGSVDKIVPCNQVG